MKYGYEGVSLSDIVEGYHISNNKIIINYLNGKIDVIDFSAIEEENILDLMLEQAIMRNELYKKNKLNYNNKSLLKEIISEFKDYETDSDEFLVYIFGMMFLSTILYCSAESLGLTTPGITQGDIAVIAVILSIDVPLLIAWFIKSDFSCIISSIVKDIYQKNKNDKRIKNKKEELKKYAIYLDMKEELDNILENSNYHDLFNGVKSDEQVLNINTLDNFSLKDIKKINSNLTGENNKGLVKKKVR